MKKILYAIVLACFLFIIAGIYPPPLQAANPCVRKTFLTRQYENACQAGGQAEAKKVAKRFLSQAKRKDRSIANCMSCHNSLAPSYTLKAGALDKFRGAGGQ